MIFASLCSFGAPIIRPSVRRCQCLPAPFRLRAFAEDLRPATATCSYLRRRLWRRARSGTSGRVRRQPAQAIVRLASQSPQFEHRVVERLDALLVVAPNFALLASAAAITSGEATGDAGVLAFDLALRRQIDQSFTLLWRAATVAGGGTSSAG